MDTQTVMHTYAPDDVVLHLDHVEDCQCRYVNVQAEQTKLIDARCISGYSVSVTLGERTQ